MALQYLDSILGTFVAHPYITIFIGLFFLGETILIPAIYFALSGKLQMPYVLLVYMTAIMTADIFWHYVGAHMKNYFARKIVPGRIQKTIEKFSFVFTYRSDAVLYFSKFIYGTRTAIQILSGLHAMPFRKYVTINFLGTFSLFLFFAILEYSIDTTVENIQGIVNDIQVGFFIFIIILVVFYLFASYYFKKIWFQKQNNL